MKYVLTRLLTALFTLVFIVTIVYFATYIGNFQQFTLPHPISEDISRIYEMYKDYLSQIIQENYWGKSSKGIEVWELLSGVVQESFKINLLALALWLPMGIILGVVTVMFKGKWIDQIIGSVTLVLSSLPAYMVILYMIFIIGYEWNLLPPQFPSETAPQWMQMRGYIIPVLSLSLWPIAHLTRLIRGELIEALQSDAYLLVRTKGFSKWQIVFRHGLRHSFVIIIPEITNLFMLVMGGSFIIERIYGIRGMAKLMFDSLIVPFDYGGYIYVDTPVVIVIVVLYASLGMVFSLFMDITYVLMDPRMNVATLKRKKI